MPDAAATETLSPFSIAPATGVGAVHLAVTDGEQALAFYRDVLGLALLSRTGEEIRLGAGGRELVVLTPGAGRQVLDRATGLYHLALLVPDRRELARVVGRLMSLRYPNSPTDHVMTKSDYLWDPDGNGIEVYAESPEDGVFGFENGMFMARDASGALRSGRDPIDLDALFGELRPGDRLDAGMPPETRMGHVHLHVRNLGDAVGFYHGLIGFDVMGAGDGSEETDGGSRTNPSGPPDARRRIELRPGVAGDAPRRRHRAGGRVPPAGRPAPRGGRRAPSLRQHLPERRGRPVPRRAGYQAR